jgi:uncharacterized membrane protein
MKTLLSSIQVTPIGEMLKSPDVKRVIIVGTLLFWCTCMIAVRVDRTGSGYYVFLIGNLFLACVPLILSTTMRMADRRRCHWSIRGVLFGLWLLFLPNAPYILTDLLHLTRTAEAPAWYDLALLLSCSGTGLLLGYLSLVDVQELVARNFTPICGWIFALVSLVLSGFAIYLGRFLRWNSWDVLLTPTRLFDITAVVVHPVSNARPLSVTLVFGIILALGYISLRILLVHPGSHSEKRS